MSKPSANEQVLPVASLKEYFRESVDSAMSNQSVALREETSHYVVNLLTLFARSEELYEHTPHGLGLRPLAMMLSDALEAPSDVDGNRALQRLGDVSLFFAGFFSDALVRKPIDVDYYVGMGGMAYGSLSERVRGSANGRALGTVFGELARKFQVLVDVLNEVSESARSHSDKDILRLYELWLKTGSGRCASLLRKLGVEPSQCAATRFQH
jgi:hypothetical protein